MSTPNMGMTEPTVGGSSGTWGALLNACLDIIDSHDHTAGKGLPIPSSALKINADVSWSFSGTHYALKDALAFDMFPTTTASVAGYSSAIFTNSADNNLYFRNSGGTNVQITAGNSLNFSVTGGFGGDYAAVGALADFIDASDQYHFYQQIGSAVRQYARVAMGDLDLFEYKANPAGGVPTQRVRLKSPAALGASYDVTWPAALPTTKAHVVMSTAGVLTAVTGLEYAHNVGAVLLSGGVATKTNGNGGAGSATRIALGTDVGIQVCPLFVPIGTLTGWSVSLFKSSAAGTITAKLFEGNSSGGGVGAAATQIGATQSNGANNPGQITLGQTGLATAMVSGREYWIEVVGGGTTGDVFVAYSATVGPP